MKYVPPIGGAANDSYVNENPATGVDGSPVDFKAIEHPLRELNHLISAAGLTPSESDLTQVHQAIITLIAASAVSGLQDLAYLDAGDGIESDGAGGARVKLNGDTLLRTVAGVALNLARANAWAAGQSSTPLAINDAAPAIDMTGPNVRYWVMGGNRTLPLPSKIAPGQSGHIWFYQPVGGGCTLAFNAIWWPRGMVAQPWATAANAINLLSYTVDKDGTKIAYQIARIA